MGKACCSPARVGASPYPARHVVGAAGRHGGALVTLPGGEFLMGTDDRDAVPSDGEGPVRRARVDRFRIDATTVTNAQFAEFVAATGYVTDAERYGWSFVFHHFVAPEIDRGIDRVPALTPWWLPVPGACWRAPEGPGSSVDGRPEHPVVHVSFSDAAEYCAWARVRLPTETEWEYAARGGLEQARYPWGDELRPGGRFRCNIWQGRFPHVNTGDDGWLGTAPVAAYEPNGFGLHNVAGNVWEWCAGGFRAPTDRTSRPMRGGSYLCHASYCNRYRVSARTANTPESSAGNIGFRVAADA